MQPSALFEISRDDFEEGYVRSIEVYPDGKACYKEVSHEFLGDQDECLKDMAGQPFEIDDKTLEKHISIVEALTFSDSGRFEDDPDGIYRIDTYQGSGSEQGVFRWGIESSPEEIESIWQSLKKAYESSDSGR